MSDRVNVSIVSPEAKIWEGQADMVVARSEEGEFGIMRGHVPFLAALIPGRVTVVAGTEREEFFVPGGFLEASGSWDDYHVIVLADDAEAIGDIDASEAQRRLDEARRRADRDEDVGQSEVQVAMARVALASSR